MITKGKHFPSSMTTKLPSGLTMNHIPELQRNILSSSKPSFKDNSTFLLCRESHKKYSFQLDKEIYTCLVIFESLIRKYIIWCLRDSFFKAQSVTGNIPDLTDFSFISSKIDLASSICPALARPSINKQYGIYKKFTFWAIEVQSKRIYI